MSLLRNELIKLNIYTEYKKSKALFYKNNINIDNPLNYSKIIQENFEELKKMDKAIKQRRYNYKIEMLKWLFYIENQAPYKYDLVFITLTFDDEALKNIQKKYRKVYIQRYLKKECKKYIANIDYGKEGREHYHALAMIDKKINLNNWNWIINVKRVPRKAKDQNKINKYILKINNHSFKDSTRQERIIKDRNKEIDKIIDNYIDKNKENFNYYKLKFNIESYA